MKPKSMSDSGFTFVETLVAVGLVGILIGASFGIGSRIVATLHERTTRLRFFLEAAQLANYLDVRDESANRDAEHRLGSQETGNSLWNPLSPANADDLLATIPLSSFPSLQVGVEAGGILLLSSRSDPTLTLSMRPPRLSDPSRGAAPAWNPVALGTVE